MGKSGWRVKKTRAQLFSFTLPVAIPNTEEIKALTASRKFIKTYEKPDDSQKLSEKIPLSILLAEDSVVNQILASKMLKKLGYEDVDIASDGLEVIENMRKKRYDLVFMDVQMPRMDGLEASQQILKTWSGEEAPLIVALTANALPEDRERCIDAGMKDYVAKPFKLDDLRNIIGKWFSS